MPDSLEKRVKDIERRLDLHDQRIQVVENKINARLVMNIQTDVAAGMKSKDVAAKHGVKPLFVSYVAPRSQFAPSMNPRLN